MSVADLSFRQSTASADAVGAHLWACDAAFVPKLSEGLDIDAYAEKIVRHAITFEAWQEGLLVGLVAAYINDVERRISYVTNVTVEPVLMGKDVAAILFESCLASAREKDFDAMELEVAQDNHRAIRFYEKFGFQVQGRRNAKLQMALNLKPQPQPPEPLTGGTR